MINKYLLEIDTATEYEPEVLENCIQRALSIRIPAKVDITKVVARIDLHEHPEIKNIFDRSSVQT